jgi:glyoxylase-like metal-dependent hydrolase (beta-lactamase superfamily II)
MQVYPNVFQLKIPIPDNPLGFINAYLVKSDQGSLLIDTGWNTDEAFESLQQQINEAGSSLADLRYIVITHIHPDHFGLAGRLKRLCEAELILHSADSMLVDQRYIDFRDVLAHMDRWLMINGVPDEVRHPMRGASLPVRSFVTLMPPDRVVNGGEHVHLGGFDLELIWTPGHSPGHLCLYDHPHRLFFSGDHVLPDTTPNVSMHTQTISNPLVDYLNALAQVAELEVDLVLPSHGEAFHDLAGRVAVIREHHEARLNAMLIAFAGGQQTAYGIAALVPWTKEDAAFDTLDALQKRFAVTETIAHLELLVAKGDLKKTLQNGLVWYSTP